MTVLSPRPTALDNVRCVAVAVAAFAQVAVAALAGADVGPVAMAYPSPVLAPGWTFAIWGPIYVGVVAHAAFQLLPAQRGRPIHRRTGWWMVLAALANMSWVLSFGADLLLLAEVVLLLLAAVLAAVFVRLSAEPAEGWLEQAASRLPVSLYTGWVAAATVQGTATTAVWIGLPPDGALTVVASIILLAALMLAVLTAVGSASGIAGLSAAVMWALVGVAVNGRSIPVALVAVAALTVVTAATLRRTLHAVQPRRVALG